MSDFEFAFYDRNDFKDECGSEITVDQYFDPTEWEFCFCGPHEDAFDLKKKLIEYAFHPKAMPYYDRCLPFTFGGESDDPYETVITIPEELRNKFEKYVISCRFTLVNQWWQD